MIVQNVQVLNLQMQIYWVPVRVTVGKKQMKRYLEVKVRATGESEEVKEEQLQTYIANILK